MGSGKSVIVRDLSKLYNVNFIDTDQEIEKKIGKNIEYIFKNHGEEYFRKIEEEICLKVLNSKNCVISLGGGSITNSKIRKEMQNNSYSVYLKVDIDTLVKRLKNSKKRPLLENVNKRKKLNELYENRKSFYNMANLILENNDNKKEILLEIKSNIEKYDKEY